MYCVTVKLDSDYKAIITDILSCRFMDCNCGGKFAYDHNANCMVCESCGRDPEGEVV